MRGREVPARSGGGRRLQRAGPRPEELQRRGDPLQAPAGASPARAARRATGSDTHSRYLEAVVEAPCPVRVASIYLPNGNPIGTEKFAYKLAWMARLTGARGRVCWRWRRPQCWRAISTSSPTPADCDNPKSWLGDALFQPESRAGAPRDRPTSAISTPNLAVGSRASRLYVLGLLPEQLRSRTTASASTTPCSRPRPPTGCWRARCRRVRAAGSGLRITHAADGHPFGLDSR